MRRKFFAGVAAFVVAGAAGASDVREFMAWQARPDGTGVAYVIREPLKQSTQLLYQDLRDGSLLAIPGHVPGDIQTSTAVLPVWSPDGFWLAYALPVNGIWRLHLWSPDRRESKVSGEREICVGRNGCPSAVLQWSADSRAVYFLAKAAMPARNGESAASDVMPGASRHVLPPKPTWREVLFADPARGGVTVLESMAGASHPFVEMPTAESRAFTDAVVYEILSAKTRVVLTGTRLGGLLISPDGARLLAVSSGNHDRGGQNYRDYYVVPVRHRQTYVAQEDGRGGGRSAKSLAPMLRNVPQAVITASWSPNSRTIAYVERVADEHGGDVHLLDVSSGESRTLTPAELPSEDGELVGEGGAASRTVYTPGRKFGDVSRVLWSPSGDALFLLRRANIRGTWQRRLWSVSLKGEARNLTRGASYEADLPLFDTSSRSDRSAVVPIYNSFGERGLARLTGGEVVTSGDLEAGRFQTGNSFGRFSQTRSAATGAAIFVSESLQDPPEAYAVDLRNGTIRKITTINGAVDRSTATEVRRVDWKSADGAKRFGLLYLPARKGQRVPLLVQVYPREPFQPPLPLTFQGRSTTLHEPLLRLVHEGYALLLPDIPTVGNGATCAGVTADLEAALDSVARIPAVDVSRSAIYGYSFGGWTVSCVITRTHRFRAAISAAGFSDLVSNTFALQDAVGFDGAGQVRIGKSVWQAPELYWQESPVARAGAVTTPLLLLHGKADDVVPVSQSAEMYVALSKQGKTVTLVTYDDRDHVTTVDHPDYEKRVMSWVRMHLGGPSEH